MLFRSYAHRVIDRVTFIRYNPRGRGTVRFAVVQLLIVTNPKQV